VNALVLWNDILLQLHRASQFCGLDHRPCISSRILTSQTYYEAKKNTVNSCLPHGLKSKPKNGLWGSLWAILSDSASSHLVKPMTCNTAHTQQKHFTCHSETAVKQPFCTIKLTCGTYIMLWSFHVIKTQFRDKTVISISDSYKFWKCIGSSYK